MVFHNEAVLEFHDVDSEVWRQRLLQAKQQLTAAARAVGRIELENDPSYEWVGTGWLVDRNILVTNRHVAQVFGMKTGASFIFRQGMKGKEIGASIDFLEEFNNNEELVVKIEKICYIEEEGGPDMAFLQVAENGNTITSPIPLSKTLPVGGTDRWRF